MEWRKTWPWPSFTVPTGKLYPLRKERMEEWSMEWQLVVTSSICRCHSKVSSYWIENVTNCTSIVHLNRDPLIRVYLLSFVATLFQWEVHKDTERAYGSQSILHSLAVSPKHAISSLGSRSRIRDRPQADRFSKTASEKQNQVIIL